MTPSKRHLLVLGAGFSKGLAGFPTIGDFFAAKSHVIWERFPFLKMTLEYFYGKIQLEQGTYSLNPKDFSDSLQERRISLEDAWDKILYMIYNPEPVLMYRDLKQDFEQKWEEEILKERAHPGGKNFYGWLRDYDPKARRDFAYLLIFADWELKKLVLETYRCDHLSRDQVNKVFEATQIDALLNQNAESTLDIISFNYDILIEMCLKERKIDFSYETDCFENHKPKRVRIIKPHGSLSWSRKLVIDSRGVFARDTVDKDSSEMILSAGDIGFYESSYKGIRHYEYLEPAMLPVVFEKRDYYYHFIPEKSENAISETLHLFKVKQTDALEDALMNCDTAHIMGYRFSNADRVVTRMFPTVKAEREKIGRPLQNLYWNLLNEKGEPQFDERLRMRARSLFFVPENKITINPNPFSCS